MVTDLDQFFLMYCFGFTITMNFGIVVNAHFGGGRMNTFIVSFVTV